MINIKYLKIIMNFKHKIQFIKTYILMKKKIRNHTKKIIIKFIKTYKLMKKKIRNHTKKIIIKIT